eukprot:scaffold787_cov402-Pavlova_lutheri.AAC.1
MRCRPASLTSTAAVSPACTPTSRSRSLVVSGRSSPSLPCTQVDRERSLWDRALAIRVGHLRRGLSKASFGACAPGSKHSCHVRGVCFVVPIDTGAGGSEVQQSLVRA